MKRKFLFILASIMLLTGLGLVLFPPISNSIGTAIAKNEIEKFDEFVNNIAEGSFVGCNSVLVAPVTLNKNSFEYKGYSFKNPKIDMGWKTCCIVLIRGGEPFGDFKKYIKTLKKYEKNLVVSEKSSTFAAS